MTPQEAFQELQQKVFAPVFFQKLASQYQLGPTNEAEAVQFLKLAELELANHYTSAKQASVQGNPVLSAALADFGVQEAAVSVTPSQVKAAAVSMLQDNPHLTEAVLVYHQAVQAAQ
jgi:hypothetical protein